MTLGAALALVAGGLAVAVAGAIAAMAGLMLPGGVGAALSTAGEALSWLRLVVVAASVLGVLRARE